MNLRKHLGRPLYVNPIVEGASLQVLHEEHAVSKPIRFGIDKENPGCHPRRLNRFQGFILVLYLIFKVELTAVIDPKYESAGPGVNQEILVVLTRGEKLNVLYFLDPLTCLQILTDPVGFVHPKSSGVRNQSKIHVPLLFSRQTRPAEGRSSRFCSLPRIRTEISLPR
ncbi:hypothetical protein ES707_16992 [subsurface metagenome]